MTPEIQEVLAGSRRWATVQADCAVLLPTFPPRSVQHVITDPPYEADAHTLMRRIKRPSADKSRWSASTNNSGVASLEALAFPPITDAERLAAGAECGRLAQRWCIVFCQVEAAMKWQGALEAGGLAKRRIGIWVKPDGQPQLSGDRPGMGYESIVFAHAKGRSRWNAGGRSSVYTHNKYTPQDGANVHPTQKPLSLLCELVENFTDPDEVVLDPFCGSGSLGIACVRLGRRYIGIDKGANEKGVPWAEIARQGIEAEQAGCTRAAFAAGQQSLF